MYINVKVHYVSMYQAKLNGHGHDFGKILFSIHIV